MTPSQSATARGADKPAAADAAIAALERPIPAGANAPGFGSDVIAEALRSLDIPYIALTPGASYRGLHDSIVNYLGNSAPQMLLCLHEEAAVAIAHGYANLDSYRLALAQLAEAARQQVETLSYADAFSFMALIGVVALCLVPVIPPVIRK